MERTYCPELLSLNNVFFTANQSLSTKFKKNFVDFS